MREFNLITVLYICDKKHNYINSINLFETKK